MMKKGKLHIYMVMLLTSLLVSCTSILDEEVIQSRNKVGITFTLSMNSVGAASRSITPDMATQYENTIDQDNFRVLAYTTDNEVHEVTIFSIDKVSDGLYSISGELKGSFDVDKVMILANCDKSFIPASTSLDMLTYSFLGSDFNPEAPQSYIPMWGVKSITTKLEPGAKTDIGTINLLRAMAKVRVVLSDESTNCELTKVMLTQYNKKGTCVPSSFNSMAATEDVEEVTIPTGVGTSSNLDFYSVNDGSYILYIPEFKNKESQPHANISVTITDVNEKTHNKDIDFGAYNNGVFANEYWDILRNHSYDFSIVLKVDANGDLTLNVETAAYAVFDLKPEYGE